MAKHPCKVFCGLPAAWSWTLLVTLCDCQLHRDVEMEVGGETHVVTGIMPTGVFVHTCARHGRQRVRRGAETAAQQSAGRRVHGACSVRSVVANNGGKQAQQCHVTIVLGRFDTARQFREECPIVYTVVEISIVTPHGSVEIERAFSDMNLYMTKLRIQLDHGHLNDAAQLRNERNRILQPFRRRGLSCCGSGRCYATRSAHFAASRVEVTVPSLLYELDCLHCLLPSPVNDPHPPSPQYH